MSREERVRLRGKRHERNRGMEQGRCRGEVEGSESL